MTEVARSLLVTTGSAPLARVAAEMIVAKEREGKAQTYRDAMESHLRVYIVPRLGADTPVAAVSAEALRNLRVDLGDADIELKTANRVLTTLRQTLKFAEERGYSALPVLPRNYPERVVTDAERWTLLGPEELRRVLAAMPAVVRPLLTFVANTGLRIGSALRTETAWIVWRDGVVHYPASVMKARRPHTAELNPAADGALRVALAASPDPEHPFPFTYWFAHDRWCEGRVVAGYPTLRIHDLRHSFVSNQLAAGTPVHVVRDLAGHASVTTTQLRGIHLSGPGRRQVCEVT
jgi:integrase